MIVVALDEGGHFEINRANTSAKCMLIGGCVFTYQDTKQAGEEAKRLENFFKTVCEEQGAKYPFDLHYNWSNGSVVNVKAAAKVKDALIEELPLFLLGCDKWGHPQGTYSLYCMVSDRNGMDQPNTPPKGNLSDDDKAAMRYEHMVYRTIENLLFHNPYLEKELEMRLDLATRVMDVRSDPKRLEDADTLGYNKRNDKDGTSDESKRIVTNAESFRTAINYAVLNNGGQDINFDLNVQSINYNQSLRKQMYLYLADTLCSFYQNVIGDVKTAENALGRLKTECEKLVEKSFLWTYSPQDADYRTIYNYAKYDNDFDALRCIYEKREKKNAIDAIYDELWYRPLLRKIEGNGKNVQLRLALTRLNDYLRSDGYNLSAAEGILSSLMRQQEHLDRKDDALLFELYKAQMTIHNHKGDFEKAMQDHKQCMAVAQYTTVEEYIGLQNTLAVALLDSNKRTEARKLAEENVSYQEMLVDIKKSIYPDQKNVYVSLARALSQLGQCFAFEGKHGQAEESFLRAIDLFGNSAEDISRTTSYLLHVYLETGEKEKYEQYVKTYIPGDTILGQLETIKKMDAVRQKFALYVFMKAAYRFYDAKSSKKAEIKKILQEVTKLCQRVGKGHPWQLIMKYCALLGIRITSSDGYQYADQCIELARAAVGMDKTGIIPEIVAFGEKEIEAAKAGLSVEEDALIRYMYR